MLPLLLWCIVGGIVALLTTIRVQLVLLHADPTAGWLAVVAGLFVGGGLLALVSIAGFRFRSLRKMGLAVFITPLLFLVLGYYGTAHYPPHNFKTADTATEWTTLHPTLRLALWLVALEDRRMVLTDIARAPAEYRQMGLKTQGVSPHYLHVDGYTHAVDLRVSNVGETRNWARQGLFSLMSLEAIRHMGTADHLHLALPG